MNIPSVSHRPGLYVRLRQACPRCDGLQIQQLPSATRHRDHEWYECEDCRHLWELPHIPPRPADR